jgi:DNA-binding protein H-NS
MAKTYAQLTQEIEALKAQAEAVRQKEKAGVAARIREAIAIYGMTAEELGLAGRSSASSVASPTAAMPTATARFRDDEGHSWSGRGPKPGWLKAGLAAGRSLESFATGTTKPKTESGQKKGKKKFKSVAKYRDDAGHEWSGRGPKPGWVKAALDAGKTLAQLAV